MKFPSVFGLFLFTISSFNFFAQTEKVNISLFKPGSHVAYLDIKQMEINTPNAVQDVRNYRVKLEQKANGIYTCQIIEKSKSFPSMFSDSLLKTIVLQFKIDSIESKIHVSSNIDSVWSVMKGLSPWKERLDNINAMIDYAPLFLEMHYLPYLEVLKDFLQGELTTIGQDIKIPNISDSISALQYDKFRFDRNQLIVTRSIVIDTLKVQKQLYKKNVLDRYNFADEETRNSIYSSTSPADFKLLDQDYDIKIISQKINQSFLVENIQYEYRYNLGNEFDRYLIFSISRIDLE